MWMLNPKCDCLINIDTGSTIIIACRNENPPRYRLAAQGPDPDDGKVDLTNWHADRELAQADLQLIAEEMAQRGVLITPRVAATQKRYLIFWRGGKGNIETDRAILVRDFPDLAQTAEDLAVGSWRYHPNAECWIVRLSDMEVQDEA